MFSLYNFYRKCCQIENKSDKGEDSSCCVTHVVTFLFLLFHRWNQCRDVDHDDDEEEAHENRAADEKCDMAFAVCGLRC